MIIIVNELLNGILVTLEARTVLGIHIVQNLRITITEGLVADLENFPKTSYDLGPDIPVALVGRDPVVDGGKVDTATLESTSRLSRTAASNAANNRTATSTKATRRRGDAGGRGGSALVMVSLLMRAGC